MQFADNADCILYIRWGVRALTDHKMEKRFSIVPDQESISKVSDFIDSCVEEYEIPLRAGYSLKVVTDEIFSNIVYYSGAKTAEILFRNDAEKVTLIFVDDGKPYNPMEAEEPDITAGIEERNIGGLGLLMVRKMAEHVQYDYAAERNQMTIILSKTAKKKTIILEDFE